MTSHTQLFINGIWADSSSGATLTVLNPATAEAIGTVSRAERSDLDLALDAAQKGFFAWRKTAAFERSKIMRRAAELIRLRVDTIARILTTAQGKPLSDAKSEILNGADVIDWLPKKLAAPMAASFPRALKAFTSS
jgi:succinate-semialdehyde dehydrogenase/glutarate-semialdehyde dehydrogenase